jgi:hypothetical protein
VGPPTVALPTRNEVPALGVASPQDPAATTSHGATRASRASRGCVRAPRAPVCPEPAVIKEDGRSGP